MATVVSGGKLRTLASSPDHSYDAFRNPIGSSWSAWYGAGGNAWAFSQVYALQPNIRTCVDFLARGIADCGLHWYRRISDTDRVRLTAADLPIVDWIEHPNYATTRYRLIESLVADLAVYFNAYWMKVRLPDRIGLVRLPPHEMIVVGGLLPDHYIFTPRGAEPQLVDLTEIVYFNGYNPLNEVMGLSPLVTLARMLAEENAAADHRENFWLNSAQVGGVIERPKDAPRWTPAQKQSWREQFQARHAGAHGSGTVAVLEDGMHYVPNGQTFRDSEYIQARKLSRTECAAAYHIPPPFVGDLEHATFSNIKEQHKQLYADTLGPWLTMIELAVQLWLLPEVKASDDIYCEFNIAEKLKGNFEEQTSSLAVAVRRAFMTANEARARLNLPRITDDPTADQLAAQQGGPANAVDANIATAEAAAGPAATDAPAPLSLVPPVEDSDADAA
jgi:HK97 family phage portal protein